MEQAKKTYQATFYLRHFECCLCCKKASAKAVQIQRAYLFRHEITASEQPAARCDGDAQTIHALEQFSGQTNTDYRTHARGQQIVVEHEQNWSDLAGFRADIRVQAGQPNFSASHLFYAYHFHRTSPSFSSQGSPGFLPSAILRASFTSGRNSFAMAMFSARASRCVARTRAAATISYMKRVLSNSRKKLSSAVFASSERLLSSKTGSDVHPVHPQTQSQGRHVKYPPIQIVLFIVIQNA